MKILIGDHFATGVGALASFSITGARVHRPDLEKWFKEIGISQKYLPRPIDPLNAYKTATGQTSKTEYPAPWLAGQRKMRLLVRHVTSTPTTVERHLIREEVDSDGRRLDYGQIGQAIFHRVAPAASYTGAQPARLEIAIDRYTINSQEEQAVTDFAAKIEADYERLCTFYTSNAIRAIVRDFTRDLNALPMTSGGSYFIHRDRLPEVEKMIEFVRRIGGGSVYNAFAVIGDDYERGVLAESVEAHTDAEIENLLDQIREINKSGMDPNSDTYQQLLAQYAAILERNSEHTNLLNINRERTSTAVQMAQMAISDLGTRVKL